MLVVVEVEVEGGERCCLVLMADWVEVVEEGAEGLFWLKTEREQVDLMEDQEENTREVQAVMSHLSDRPG